MSNLLPNQRHQAPLLPGSHRALRSRLINIALNLIFAASVAGFWLVEQTTPARIGSLAFFLLVSLYAYLNSRYDVLGSCTLFFGLLDITQYLTYMILPLSLGLVASVALFMAVWALLFGKSGWYLAIASALIATEIALSAQYINIELKLQVFLIMSPFIIACQYYYFQLAKPQSGENTETGI
jgi:hypothetical protein